MIKKLLLKILLIIMVVFSVSCANKNINNNIEEEKDETEMELRLKIDDVNVDVLWEDNESVLELKNISKNGLSLKLNEYGGFEQTGLIGKTIVSNDEQMDVSCGDIVLYNSRQICLYYDDNSWSFTKLGKINLAKERIIELLDKNSVNIYLYIG